MHFAYTPNLRALSVELNGDELPRHAWWEEPGEITLLTRGLDADADTNQKDFDLGFSPGSGAALRVAVNGVQLAGAPYGVTGPVLSLFAGLARGDHLTVWCLDAPTPLSSGDLVLVTSTEPEATRLAPPPPADDSQDRVWARALTLVVEIPRALTTDERRLVLHLLDVMRSAKARLLLVEGAEGAVRRPWRLGRAGLGWGTRVGRG